MSSASAWLRAQATRTSAPLRVLGLDLARALLALATARLAPAPPRTSGIPQLRAEALVAAVLGLRTRADERGGHHSTLSSTSSGAVDSIRYARTSGSAAATPTMM